MISCSIFERYAHIVDNNVGLGLVNTVDKFHAANIHNSHHISRIVSNTHLSEMEVVFLSIMECLA